MGRGPPWPAGPLYKEGRGWPATPPSIASSSGRLSLHHTLLRLRRSPAVFFLHLHHHAVVLLNFGGDLPHLRCPLERERKELHRHRTRDRIMAPPSINFNQFLEKEKLKGNGSNFTDWFRHVRIFLEACNILEAELQKRFEHHDPCEMMRELKLIFETHAAVESYEASKQFFTCMMEEGSSVSEHMLVMSGHAKKLNDLGMMIPNQLGIHRVLQSLPPSYKNFVMNYNMQNINKDLPEIFSMLKSAEVEIKKENQVLMVNKTTSFKKQGKPNKGNFKKGGKKVAAHPEKPKAGPKPETVCYYCQGKGHWKRNCSKYLADLKSGHVKRKEFLTKEVTGRKVELDEVTEPSLIDQSSAVPEEVSAQPTPTGEEANDDDHEASNEEATEPRRSTRERTTPDWYDPCLNVMIVDNNDEDPATYEEAMMSPIPTNGKKP
ncbi:hypothetical protein QYE76_012254 [Lolium multiflorum]|uniref:CCHC-type domain-containing protein n=1 Tax=Lolium multiflorum TaxID=4521 RepID=A0AAD8TYY6_LOLMU|nr:hypothetical protein QYE76_012254 [Lolium multiflorum]